MSEYRQNPLTGDWVIQAPLRGERPGAMLRPDAAPPAPEREAGCPFCPGQERQTPPEVFAWRFDRSAPDTPGWAVRVFPNKFPAVVLDAEGHPTPEDVALRAGQPTTAGADTDLAPWNLRRPGVGRHEVLVESPFHNRGIADHDERHLGLVLDGLRSRFRQLMQTRDLKHVSVFQNRGEASGETIPHPHFQLVATTIAPDRAVAMLGRQEQFVRENGRSLFDAVLDAELESGRRIVASNDEFVAFAPWASRTPYELWIAPREHVAFLGDVSDSSLPLLAALLRDVMRRLARTLGSPAYQLVIHNGPRSLPAADHFRMFVQIMPCLTRLGAFEHGTGVYINHVPPETAAEAVRAAG